MRFDWDPPKAAENLRKHRVSFEDAGTIFADSSILTVRDDAHSQHEDRWASMGVSMRGRALVVIHTWPELDESESELVRIISARRASKREQEVYLERKQ